MLHSLLVLVETATTMGPSPSSATGSKSELRSNETDLTVAAAVAKLAVESNKTDPSLAPLATILAPISPPPPVRFSTITVVFSLTLN